MVGYRVTIVLAILTGVALELVVQAFGARREAWDSPVFWTVGMPVALVTALLIGLVSHGRAWLATAVIAPAQFMTMIVRSGEVGGLWPLGLVLSTVLSTPFVIAAFAGSVAGRRFRENRRRGTE